MFFYKGLSCPHCSKPFEETDDVVSCPVCGAPHHRACWMEHGGCSLADAHGTDAQWSRDDAVNKASNTPTSEADETATPPQTMACPRCGEHNSVYAERCSRCGLPLRAQEWHSPQAPFGAPRSFHEYTPFRTPYTSCGGVSPDAVLEDESARDLAAIVRTNTVYYLPRFERMARSGVKIGWNWAAFLFPAYWLLFRKQYLAGAAMLVINIVYSVVSSVLMALCFPTLSDVTGYAALYKELQWLMQTDERAMIGAMLIMAVSLIPLCARLLVAIFGNRLYMKRCLRLIKSTRAVYPEGYHAQLGMIGGTSTALALVGYLADQLIPAFILMLLS